MKIIEWDEDFETKKGKFVPILLLPPERLTRVNDLIDMLKAEWRRRTVVACSRERICKLPPLCSLQKSNKRNFFRKAAAVSTARGIDLRSGPRAPARAILHSVSHVVFLPISLSLERQPAKRISLSSQRPETLARFTQQIFSRSDREAFLGNLA